MQKLVFKHVAQTTKPPLSAKSWTPHSEMHLIAKAPHTSPELQALGSSSPGDSFINAQGATDSYKGLAEVTEFSHFGFQKLWYKASYR